MDWSTNNAKPSDRSKNPPKTVKLSATYSPLEAAIQYSWSGFTKRQTKEVNPGLFFIILGEDKFMSTNKSL